MRWSIYSGQHTVANTDLLCNDQMHYQHQIHGGSDAATAPALPAPLLDWSQPPPTSSADCCAKGHASHKRQQKVSANGHCLPARTHTRAASTPQRPPPVPKMCTARRQKSRMQRAHDRHTDDDPSCCTTMHSNNNNATRGKNHKYPFVCMLGKVQHSHASHLEALPGQGELGSHNCFVVHVVKRLFKAPVGTSHSLFKQCQVTGRSTPSTGSLWCVGSTCRQPMQTYSHNRTRSATTSTDDSTARADAQQLANSSRG